METQPEETLIRAIRYNNWANAQILAVCLGLTTEQLAATVPGTYGAIHETLGHMIYAEADYVGRLTGDRPQPPFEWKDAGPSVAEIFAFSGQVANALLDAIRCISPTQIVHEEEVAIHRLPCRLLFSKSSTTVLSIVRTSLPSSAAWVYPPPKWMVGLFNDAPGEI